MSYAKQHKYLFRSPQTKKRIRTPFFDVLSGFFFWVLSANCRVLAQIFVKMQVKMQVTGSTFGLVE